MKEGSPDTLSRFCNSKRRVFVSFASRSRSITEYSYIARAINECTSIRCKVSQNEAGFFTFVGWLCSNGSILRYLLPDTSTEVSSPRPEAIFAPIRQLPRLSSIKSCRISRTIRTHQIPKFQSSSGLRSLQSLNLAQNVNSSICRA